MKMKHLVLGTLCLTLCASTAWARPKILDGSVIGRWNFDNASSLVDDSGYGGSAIKLGSYTTHSTSGGYQRPDSTAQSGYVTVQSKKTFTAYLGDDAPSCNMKNSPYYTFASRFRSTDSSLVPSSTVRSKPEFAIFNDTENWHFFAYRYHNDTTGSSYKEVLVCDPKYNDNHVWNLADGTEDKTRNLEMTASYSWSSLTIPLSISGKTVTIGGSFPSSIGLVGGLDECVIVNRRMTKAELTRFYQTGDTYIYHKTTNTGAPSFAAAGGWSSGEGSWNPAPGDLPGAAYLVDNNKTMTQTSGTFGGSLDKKISLTIGRKTAATIAYLDKSISVAAPGMLTTSGALVFYDLRLCNGAVNASGASLTTTLFDVDTPDDTPFNFNVTSSDYALNVTEDTTGSGVLAKTGAGKLTVGKWTGTAKLRLAEGSIKTPRLDGYTGGTVIVDGDAVTFTGEDTLSGTIQVRYDGTIAAAEATYPVLNAPTLTSASQVAISATIPEKYEGTPKLENGVVSLVVTKKVAPIPDEDKGAKPVLLWQ